ncbi:MAG: hypothetical protein K0Q68_641 [Moraxellaceae bacterium]|nr:hypothetical protein [Moraxellaceae bacterium]
MNVSKRSSSTRDQGSRGIQAIQVRAEQLLVESDALSIPVDVEKVAQYLGAKTHFEPLENEISGMLVIEDDVPHIMVNASHHSNRQRFTVAHEVGHLVLHKDQGTLFVDTKYRVYKRAGAASAAIYASPDSTTSYEHEVEANKFAESLLMPKSLVLNYIASKKVDISDEFDIALLALAFGVSDQAMSIRVGNLKLCEVA